MKIGARRLRGQGLVEFALVLPILLMIILGIIEAALVIQGHLSVQHVARETARWAVTYQPVQGACVDRDNDDQIADGFGVDDVAPWGVPDDDDLDDLAAHPYCPLNGAGDPDETDADYYARRVELIKRRARRLATGLRIREEELGLTEGDFQTNLGDAGFFGVRVWGYPSIDTDCNADPDACLDHPGLQGLPMQVLVVHNVEILDPFYRVIVEHVTVQATAQMINEGVQVGLGDRPPPHFDVNRNPLVPTVESTPVGGPGEETPTATSEPTPLPTVPPEYTISLADPVGDDNPSNEMPDDRCHDFVATVTFGGSPVESAWVSFSTDMGSFDYSGSDIDEMYAEALTNAQGKATVTLCGNEPGMASLRAWIDDEGGDDVWIDERSDTATKTWYFPPGQPYITVGDHDVVALDPDTADIMNHPEGDYALHWCVISGTNTSTVLTDTVTVGGTGNVENLLFIVPDGSDGMYRLETHPSGGGGCGAGDLVAYSADIRAVIALPDLAVSITDPLTVCSRTTFTMSVVVQNMTNGKTDEYFDVDFYVDPEGTPQSPIGVLKQWVSGIGPGGSVVVNTLMWVDSPGAHTIWARVDTSDFVEEGNEANNAASINVSAGGSGVLFEDTFDRADNSTVGNGWTEVETSDARVRVASNQLDFYDTSDAANRPMVSHGFGEVPSGELTWEFDFNWVRSGSEGTYRIFMQLGDGDSMSDSSWDQGVGVNLIWTELGGIHERLGYRRNGSNTSLATVSGLQRISVTVDLDNQTYDVAVAGSVVGSGIAFEDAVDLNTVRFFTDAVNEGNFSGRSFDDVRVSWEGAGGCGDGDDPPPWGEGPGKPPGLLECQHLLQYGGFDSTKASDEWEAGPSGSFQYQSQFFYNPTLSMRLHTSLGSYPTCDVLPNPYLYQTVEIPTEVYTQTTINVRGQRLVAPSLSACCYDDRTDPEDVLYLKMRDDGGDDLVVGSDAEVVTGGVVTETWDAFDVDVTDVVSPVARGGQSVQVYLHGVQSDADFDCTYFYLDALECEMCTYWEIPEPITGTASFGGLIQVFLHGVPRRLQGVDVWAYGPSGGDVYHTYTIQDINGNKGIYSFHNIPPGTYTIYAEYWEGGPGGTLHYGTWTVSVAPDERNFNVNLYMS